MTLLGFTFVQFILIIAIFSHTNALNENAVAEILEDLGSELHSARKSHLTAFGATVNMESLEFWRERILEFISTIKIQRETTYRKACTSLILKWKNNEFFVLFLKRSIWEGSRFSGQICFPGGHKKENETHFETCVRETKEETGINIAAKEFEYLGQVNDHALPRSPLVIGCHVFLYKEDAQTFPKLKLQQKEIRGAAWVKLTLFQNPNFVKVPWKINGISYIAPGILIHKDTTSDWVLWGITLRLIGEFLKAFGWKRVSEVSNIPNMQYLKSLSNKKHSSKL